MTYNPPAARAHRAMPIPIILGRRFELQRIHAQIRVLSMLIALMILALLFFFLPRTLPLSTIQDLEISDSADWKLRSLYIQIYQITIPITLTTVFFILYCNCCVTSIKKYWDDVELEDIHNANNQSPEEDDVESFARNPN